MEKVGLRLSVKKMKELTARQILAHKVAPQAPVSSLSLQEAYIMNEGKIKALKTKIDLGQTPILKGTQAHETKDFERYRQVISSPTSKKVFISPLGAQEKVGPKWG